MTQPERGSALLETVLLGLILLMPVIWAVGVLADLHRGALASTAAAREAGFDAARASSAADARRAVDVAVARAFRDHGLDPADASIEWSAPSDLNRGGQVEVRISYSVPVAQAPFIGRVGGPSINVRARHVARIDPYRSRGVEPVP